MNRNECREAMRFGRKLFKQQKPRFNGTMKFAYVTNDGTGETVFYSPDKTTSDRISKCLNMEFGTL